MRRPRNPYTALLNIMSMVPSWVLKGVPSLNTFTRSWTQSCSGVAGALRVECVPLPSCLAAADGRDRSRQPYCGSAAGERVLSRHVLSHLDYINV
jgi:hypothetical protein